MSTRNLDKLLSPNSVVAIGASNRPGSVGEAVTRNLLGGGFKGDINLVNLKGGTIEGRPVLKSVRELKAPPDLAVIMTPPASVPRRPRRPPPGGAIRTSASAAPATTISRDRSASRSPIR